MSKIHDINLPVKYFEPIQNKKIKLLIFDKKVINEYSEGDKISIKKGAYEVSSLIKKTYIKSFGEITPKEVEKAGFISKDFLKDELISRFDIDGFEVLLGDFDSRIFFFIELKEEKEEKEKTYFSNTTTSIPNDYFDFFGKKIEKIDDWTDEISKVRYNMEYYDKPWRDYDEEF